MLWRSTGYILLGLGVLTLNLVVGLITASPADTAPGDHWFDTSQRPTVLAAFEAEFSREIPDINWQRGDLDSCQPGVSSQAYRRATITRVNYYRAMAGVAPTVVEDYQYSAKAQRTAMMMSAQDELSHQPHRAYRCFTPYGQEGAANSNLYLGRSGPRAIDGYIEDPGPDNTDVGHRATILHPPTHRMGVGNVGATNAGREANALWVFDERVFDESKPWKQAAMREAGRFVAWPPRGYVPQALVYPRWSLTLAGADFSQAEVIMYRQDRLQPGPIPLEVVDRVGAPGHVPLSTIVWEPQIDPESSQDTYYTVIVTQIHDQTVDPGTPLLPITYTVRIMGQEPTEQKSTTELLASFARVPVAQ